MTVPMPTDRRELLDALVQEGLLIESGVPGVYGHGEKFERVRTGLERAVSAQATERGASRLQFPPLIPRDEIESIGYLGNFPHLAGSVFSFEGDDAGAKDLAKRAAAHEDWSDTQTISDVMLTPAACYPLYPALAKRGTLPEGGVLIDIGAGWVFRHEPSEDPARRQIFRMHEIVRVAAPDTVQEWRQDSIEWGLTFLKSLGIDVELDQANDPFFGRGGRMMAANQRAQALKLEYLAPITDGGRTAIASSNYHQEHFGEHYDLKLPDGQMAHTSCLAFGHDRVVLALIAAHGFDPDVWPAPVQAILSV